MTDHIYLKEFKQYTPSGMYICLDSKRVYINMQKEVSEMDFDVEKIRAYYTELLANKEMAVSNALFTKDDKVKERVAELTAKYEEDKAKIPAEVEAELIADAEQPYLHDIELCEKFLVDEEETTEEVEAE
jgi:hypothetical protein